jgi:hypothetical protein
VGGKAKIISIDRLFKHYFIHSINLILLSTPFYGASVFADIVVVVASAAVAAIVEGRCM